MEDFDPVGGGYIVDRVAEFLSGFWSVDLTYGMPRTLIILQEIALILSIIFMGGIIYVLWKLKDFRPTFKTPKFEFTNAEEGKFAKSIWDNISKRMESGSDADWSLAIIEADNLVDEVLKRSGLQGDTMLERLNQLNPTEVESVKDLKEVHRVRNNIAHTPGYKIPRDEAERIMNKYKSALEELEVI